MGVADWDIAIGDPPAHADVWHEAFQHSLVPTEQLTHDIWARRLDINTGGSAYGRIRFAYDGVDAAQFTTAKDVSVRALMCLGIRDAPVSKSSIGLGVRMDAVVPDGATDQQAFSNNGYHLILWQDGSNWQKTLYRTVGGSKTQLWTATPVSGSIGDYKWFHLRLDFLLQPSDDAILQVFESTIVDPATYNPATPVWQRISGGPTSINELDTDVPGYAGVGFGSQVQAGTGMNYESYIDWAECWYSA